MGNAGNRQPAAAVDVRCGKDGRNHWREDVGCGLGFTFACVDWSAGVEVLVLKRHQKRHLFDFHISAVFVMPVGNLTYLAPMLDSQLAPMAFSVVVFEFNVLSKLSLLR
uniref:Uncharacterized protein n=2 Tax=Oryza TaxID=4527 RepID=Q2QU18_ORYSJ|nr:hypothetical protein LOC_Os12g17790 [Oryza sativa Japonica Group]